MKRPLDPVSCLNVALVLAMSEIVLLTATRTVTFSWYGYFADFRVLPLLQGIGLDLVAVSLVILRLHLVDRYPLIMPLSDSSQPKRQRVLCSRPEPSDEPPQQA